MFELNALVLIMLTIGWLWFGIKGMIQLNIKSPMELLILFWFLMKVFGILNHY